MLHDRCNMYRAERPRQAVLDATGMSKAALQTLNVKKTWCQLEAVLSFSCGIFAGTTFI